MGEKNFHDQLKEYIHEYILLTYASTKKYPKDEQYGLTSQDRRAAVSVMLNYIEGYAGGTWNMTAHQYEIGFASLKESIYARYLAKELGYISEEMYKEALVLKEKIAPMLYTTIRGIRQRQS
jgi:four helix bundle protein